MSGHDSHPDDPLTTKEECFVNYFIQGYTASKAAKLAGFKNYSQPHRMPHFPNIAKKIKALRKEINRQSMISAEQKMKLLWDIAEGNSNVYTKISKDGHQEIELKKEFESLDPKVSIAAVQELNRMQGDHAPEKSEIKTDETIKQKYKGPISERISELLNKGKHDDES